MMAGRVLFYPRGTVLLMSSGEYSDYGYVGQLVTVQDCDLPALAKQMREEFKPGPNRSWIDKADPDDFPSWLVAKGYCVPLDCSTVHVGDYCEWSRELAQ